MGINKILLSLATLVLATACSNDDETTVKSPTVVGNSDVEIKLSMGSSTGTRASVESDANGMFDLDNLGIFMLGTAVQTTNPDEQTIDWRPAVNPYAIWMNNVEASAVKNGESTRTDILWADGETRWYPVGNWYSYRFYGYYPRVEDSQVSLTSSKCVVTYTGLDGTKDIIWGRSLGADLDDAKEKYRYSARYFRQAGYGDYNPELSLNHKMLRLQFAIQGIGDENAEAGHEFDAANTMFIDTIIVTQVPTTARLTVADLNNQETGDGVITYDWIYDLQDLGVLGENDGTFVKKQIHDDDIIEVGQPILLPVLDSDATAAGYTKYKIKVRLRNDVGVLFDHEKPLDLNIADGGSGFEAGKSYRVVLKIAGPKQVTLQARLAGWESDEVTVAPLTFD